MEDLQRQLNNKILEYEHLSKYLDRTMVDPYHEYDDLQLGSESLKPIFIKPNLNGVNYQSLVNAEIKVGLESILSSIVEFIVKIFTWIKNKILSGYKWLVNANDDIQTEVAMIRNNAPSELHNKLIRVSNTLSELDIKFDNEFASIIDGYTLQDSVELYRIKSVNGLIEDSNIVLPTVEYINTIISFRDGMAEEFEVLYNNLLTGTIPYNEYIKKQSAQLIDYGGFNSKLVKQIEEEFIINGNTELKINSKSVVEEKTTVKKGKPFNHYLMLKVTKNIVVNNQVLTPIGDIMKLTIGDILDIQSPDYKFEAGGDYKLSKGNSLHIKVSGDDVDKSITTKTMDVAMLISKLQDDINVKHAKLISAIGNDYANLFRVIDTLILSNINLVTKTYKNSNKILKIVNKEYKKSISIAEKMIDAINKQRG